MSAGGVGHHAALFLSLEPGELFASTLALALRPFGPCASRQRPRSGASASGRAVDRTALRPAGRARAAVGSSGAAGERAGRPAPRTTRSSPGRPSDHTAAARPDPFEFARRTADGAAHPEVEEIALSAVPLSPIVGAGGWPASCRSRLARRLAVVKRRRAGEARPSARVWSGKEQRGVDGCVVPTSLAGRCITTSDCSSEPTTSLGASPFGPEASSGGLPGEYGKGARAAPSRTL